MSTINLAGGNTLLNGGSFSPVRAASTGALTLSGLQTVDGVTLAANDRVLVKDQTDQTTNGIYAMATGPWIRTSDAQTNTQVFQGMTVTTGPQGAVNAGQTFVCTTTDDPVVVGTSLITFASQQTVQTQQQTATSTTSLTIGTGSQTLAIQAGKAFQANQEILIYETSNTANSMVGPVTSYSGTSLVVNVSNVKGSGTHADWTVVLYNSVAAAGITPPIGVGDVAGPGSATDGNVVLFSGTTGKVIKDSGKTLGALTSLSAITAQFLASSAIGYATGMLNGTLVASVAANALTITLKTLAGATPSATDPVWLLIPNGTGGYTVIEQTAALSITVPTGASVGTVNAQANRIWVGVFNNAGAAVLGVYNSLNSTGPTILCWDETSTAIGNAIAAGSNSAQTWYTASGIAATNFRILGYVESTQATAGTWATSPSKTMLMGPGVKRPGETVQEQSNPSTAASTTISATNVAIGPTQAITLTSAANLIRVKGWGTMEMNIYGQVYVLQLVRGSTLIGMPQTFGLTTVAEPVFVTNYIEAFDIPGASATYGFQGRVSGASTLSWPPAGGTGVTISAQEIQI